MPKKYPPLTVADVRAILKAAGFLHSRTESSHEFWEHEDIGGRRRFVTVDTGYSEFDQSLIKTMIAQSGLSRDDFYCQVASTARKINKRIKRAES